MSLRNDDLCNFLDLWYFSDFLAIFWLFDNLDKSTTVSSALPPLLTTSSVPSSVKAKFDNPVVFNIKVSSAAIHLKTLESELFVRINTLIKKVEL